MATTLAFRSESYGRGARMLRTALGPAIASFLDDASVVGVMLNADGRLWIDRLTGGLEDSGALLSPADDERVVRLVAHHVGAEVHAHAPRVSAALPETGERFEGLLPPVVTAPSITPHVAINGTISKLGKIRRTLIDKRTTRHPGYAISQRVRKRIEEAFGWAKPIGGIAKLKVRGLARADAALTFQMIAYNLIRIPKLIG